MKAVDDVRPRSGALLAAVADMAPHELSFGPRRCSRSESLSQYARLEEALIALLPTLENRVLQLCLNCCEATDAQLHDIAECDWATERFADQPASVYCTPRR
jgi:hypothetical protein